MYGFRNIQTLVRKMKRKSDNEHFDFVEVMACPSGCLNGGGQIKLGTRSHVNYLEFREGFARKFETTQELLDATERAYYNSRKNIRMNNEYCLNLSDALFNNFFVCDEKCSQNRTQFLHTQFHNRPNKLANGFSIDTW